MTTLDVRRSLVASWLGRRREADLTQPTSADLAHVSTLCEPAHPYNGPTSPWVRAALANTLPVRARGNADPRPPYLASDAERWDGEVE